MVTGFSMQDLEVDPVRPQRAPGGDPAIGGDHHAVDEAGSASRWKRMQRHRLSARANGSAHVGVVPLLLQRLIDYGIATGYLRGRTVQRTSG